MSFLMMLAASGARQLKTATFTANGTFNVPASTFQIESASGYGARGTNGSVQESWRRDIIITYFRRDGGPNHVISGGSSSDTGPIPRSDYCDPATNYSFEESPTYFASQVCYEYVDTSKNTPPKTGAPATAFGKTFPGSTGNVAPPVASYAGIAVTPSEPCPIVVPAGGSITITYYE